MAIPSPAVEEMIRYLDEDNNGYIELDEWLQV
jgi:Ca2+-binding EF-hand superfamily protein